MAAVHINVTDCLVPPHAIPTNARPTLVCHCGERSFSPRQIYDVVAAVEHYHEFVPWCQRRWGEPSQGWSADAAAASLFRLHAHRLPESCPPPDHCSTIMLRRPPNYLEAELEVGFQMFVER